jgi:hypothetical protein
MHCLYILLLGCSLLPVCSFSQHKDTSNTLVVPVTKLLFFSPGASYELPIGKQHTLVAGAFMHPSFTIGGSPDRRIIDDFATTPAAELGYRYYYNAAARQRKGKRTAMNSMNYLSGRFGISYTDAPIGNNRPDEPNNRAVYSFGAVWGLQRNYARRFSLDLQVGVGYGFGIASQNNAASLNTRTTVGQLGVITDIALGFWLNKRRR